MQWGMADLADGDLIGIFFLAAATPLSFWEDGACGE